MSFQDFDLDRYQDYEDRFDARQHDRQERRKRKPRQVTEQLGQSWLREAARMDETGGNEEQFKTTYRPSKYEAEWLIGSLTSYFDRMLITDVLALVKGGKEASVYRCAAHPTTGKEFLAAKVYRPHKFRALSNDAMYKEGRSLLTAEQHAVKEKEDRIWRAVGKKSAFGRQVSHTSWLMHEYQMLEQLHADGAAVPEPIATAENAILMGYRGDGNRPAPTLIEVDIDPAEAEGLFREVMRNVELMLSHGMAHGDLSAYNILYWQGEITVIDFPQVTPLARNSQSRAILERDITRVVDYFARYGLDRDPQTITDDLWRRYRNQRAIDRKADLSRMVDSEDVV
jgi:RIO kinase 1